jgi:hypothetical protein
MQKMGQNGRLSLVWLGAGFIGVIALVLAIKSGGPKPRRAACVPWDGLAQAGLVEYKGRTGLHPREVLSLMDDYSLTELANLMQTWGDCMPGSERARR